MKIHERYLLQHHSIMDGVEWIRPPDKGAVAMDQCRWLLGWIDPILPEYFRVYAPLPLSNRRNCYDTAASEKISRSIHRPKAGLGMK